MRYGASVFNATVAVAELSIYTSRDGIIHAFKVTTFSCHLHAQLIIPKHVILPGCLGQVVFSLTYTLPNKLCMDSPEADSTSPAYSHLFFLVSSYLGSLVSFFSQDHQSALKRR